MSLATRIMAAVRGKDYSLAFPTPAINGMFGYSGSSTGIPITPLTALQSSSVYACVKCLSEDIGKLPLVLRRRLPDGGFVVDVKHPLNKVLRRPNRWQTPIEFWSYIVVSLMLRGNGFAAIKRGPDGAPQALIPLNWDRVSVILAPSGSLYYNVSHPLLGDGITLAAEDVLHIRNFSVDGGYLGVSPIAAAPDVVGLALATQQHGSILFRQGAQLSGVLKHPATLTKETAERIGQSWRDAYAGVQNSHKVAVLEEGMSFEKISMTNEDAEFLQTRAFQSIEICRLFRVPPHKIHDLTRATFSNIENESQQYIDDALQPIATRIEQCAENNLLFDDERGEYQIQYDFRALLRGDQKTRFEAYAVGLQNGFLNQNEVRLREGDNPIPGGDVYRMQLNMAPISTAAAADPDPIVPADNEVPGLDVVNPPYDGEDVGVSAETMAFASSMTEIAGSISKMASAIESKAAPVINLTVPPANIIVPIEAKIDATRSVTKTVVSERKPDGTIVSKVTET